VTGPGRATGAALLLGTLASLLAACAGPPLVLYTLGAGQASAEGGGLPSVPMIIAVDRIAIPEELDSEDILVRAGASLLRSAHGRWASRLSTEMTNRVTAQLAQRRPDALVTSAPQRQTPTYRIIITLSRFDITADGQAIVVADWLIVPKDPAEAARRDRTAFTTYGPVANDLDVVLLEGKALDRLSDAIVLK